MASWRRSRRLSPPPGWRAATGSWQPVSPTRSSTTPWSVVGRGWCRRARVRRPLHTLWTNDGGVEVPSALRAAGYRADITTCPMLLRFSAVRPVQRLVHRPVPRLDRAVPTARRRSLASAVLAAAMTDARQRGRLTASLQATPIAESLCARSGCGPGGALAGMGARSGRVRRLDRRCRPAPEEHVLPAGHHRSVAAALCPARLVVRAGPGDHIGSVLVRLSWCWAALVRRR